jgi:very-short-patch-repair endonuclease
MAEDGASALRDLLFGPLEFGRHVDITSRFEALGLTEPNTSADGSASKARRVTTMLASLPIAELRRVGAAVLEAESLTADQRNRIQDVLWNGQGPVILKKARRALAAALDIETLVVEPARFEKMLDRWWVLDLPDLFAGLVAGAFGPPGTAPLRQQIQRHVFDNIGDWSAETLFDKLGAFEAVDRRFAGFIEETVSHRVVVHETHQRNLVAAMTPALREAALELRETGTEDGYPVFHLVSTGAPLGRPKNVIFGSNHKPDLRASDTVDNEIEILNTMGNLVYDDPIGVSGVRWIDLEKWWHRHHPELDSKAAKKTLYNRLQDALPTNSPPQRRLFEQYYRIDSRRIPYLPALLPEVWLHWDHKTVQQRGVRALLGQRMDFLLLAPNHQRIILEVDGVGHYSDDDGRASPQRYASNARYDRDMQMRGYAVYRFGGAELHSDRQAAELLNEFFELMFSRHGIADC